MLEECRLCPRQCRVSRTNQTGYCKMQRTIKVARAALHYWEEPCISGEKGSGTIFFSGCNLGCVYCQNYKISHEGYGKEITVERLAEIMQELQEKGAQNINLVTPTHFIPEIKRALDLWGKGRQIPVVYNCGGYERPEIIKTLEGYVDIFLTDIKYFSEEKSVNYSSAPGYFDYATRSFLEMQRILGKPQYDEEGRLLRGVLVRHLVLPGGREDSMKILDWLAEVPEKDSFILSLMSQYTPCGRSKDFSELHRRVTSYEYQKVLNHAIELGLTQGYMQERTSAKEEYTPPFDLTGV